MADENSLGPLGPNVVSVEPVSDLVYSVQGDNFVAGYRVEVRDGVGQTVESVRVSEAAGTSFTLHLPFATTGPYTLVVINPDQRTSTAMMATPGTSASNQKLRAGS